MTSEQGHPTELDGDEPSGEGRSIPDEPGTEAAEPAETAATAAGLAAPSIVLSPPSLFPDRELTPVEAKRQAIAPTQPKPWEPTSSDLDPSSDEGWDRAAGHELIAVRPEDVVLPPSFVPAGAAADAASVAADATAVPAQPVDAHHALPVADPSAAQRYLAPTTSALAWSKGGAPAPTVPPTVPPAASTSVEGATTSTAAFTPFGAATQSPLLTPLSSMGQPAAAQGVATGPVAIPPEAAAVAVATGAAHRRPWTGAQGGVRTAARGMARPVTLLILFVLGIVFGTTVYSRSQPAPVAQQQVAQATVEPGVTHQVPPQIQSLIAAVDADDQSQIQIVVPADPYRLFAGELAARGIVRLLGATAMSTYVMGPDSATEILVTGFDAQGNGLTFNLVVHMHDGQISDFR